MKQTFDLNGLDTYELVEEHRLKDLNSDGFLLRHKKTGAKVVLLSNDDDNKVFYIGFRTPPKDSTGVAHIVEHSVLCGSKEFPLKDPFVELAKGSLNTFLNAMTYPDKTVYPIASCNDTDFKNLMHVYLDAVFYPNIYREERIFMQEGWHYEMETPEDDLKINGVVYNEMKGAFSAPDEVLERYIKQSLFPDITYGIESGGDPEIIPDLTYEAFLDFHKRYYHPSNSYIYLYGDMDMRERLEFLDQSYLSKFDRIDVDSEVQLQQDFEAPKELEVPYGVLDASEEEDGTYFSYNVKLGDCFDKEHYIAFSAIDYALCSSPGAVLKKKLIEKGIGEDVYASYSSELKQPMFSIIAKNARPEHRAEFAKTIEDVLCDVVVNGYDKRTLQAALNVEEFHYREADFGRFPRGLAYGLQMLDSWLHDFNAPWNHLEAGETFAALKEKVAGSYFEELTKEYLLDNPHRTLLTLTPKARLSVKKEEALHKALQDKKAAMSKEEIERIVASTASLHAYQEEEPTPEELLCIPLLERKDLKKEAEPFRNEVRSEGKTPVLFHEVDTSGIAYLVFSFDLSALPDEYLEDLYVLKAALGMMDTENFTYPELNNEIHLLTGGLGYNVMVYPDYVKNEGGTLRFEVSAKVLYDHLPDAFRLVSEIIGTTKFEDEKRLKEILDEWKATASAALSNAGHMTAALRALSHVTAMGSATERISGISTYRKTERYASHFEEEKEGLIGKLQEMAHIIFRPENLLVDLTMSKEVLPKAEERIPEFTAGLFTQDVPKGQWQVHKLPMTEAFKTGGQVLYVARAGNFREKGLPYTGALHVLKVILGYDYLWNNIRVKGGAYGCMSSFARTGDCYFVSYRDPHLKQTIDVFEKASEYIRNIELDDRTILKFIIGTLSELDMPRTPSQKGTYGMVAHMTGLTMERLQKERDELMGIDVETVRSLAKYIDAFLSDHSLVTVGDAGKIESEAELFEHVEQLISA